MAIDIVFTFIIVFLSIILHEIAHGYVAFKLGDPTAKNLGRLTLNPIKHLDPLGSIILPGILLLLRYFGHNVFIFGWAKPVPINPSNFSSPKKGMALVAVAGPLVNFILAGLLSIPFHMQDQLALDVSIYEKLAIGIYFNLLLIAVNLIPIPPLDGSRIVAAFLPEPMLRQYYKLEGFGIVVIFLLLYFGLFEKVITPMIELLAQLLGLNL